MEETEKITDYISSLNKGNCGTRVNPEEGERI